MIILIMLVFQLLVEYMNLNQIGANNIEGKSSFFSGAISRNFSGITTNPTGNKLINLGVNFISGLSNSEINKGSGEIVYLDNRPLIVRNSSSKGRH